MLRFIRRVAKCRPPCFIEVPTAGYKNYVLSEALEQIERDCNRFCQTPRFPPQKVTVIGAGSDVGQIVSLLLKQQKLVKMLAMYDDEPAREVLGVANDLAHIDTSTEVEAFQGRVYLCEALHDADVVLICGGSYPVQPYCEIEDRALFQHNLQYVRSNTIATAQFAPHAILAIQTPPVDCNFALAMHTLKWIRSYDKRRLLGVNSISSMRAQQLVSALTGSEPGPGSTPVVGGTGRCTRVPLFAKKTPNIPQKQIDFLTRLVREADEIICKVKSNNEQGHLSIGFATARCVINIMQGLFEKPTTIDSALVEQGDPDKCFGMKICATPVTIGPGGIQQYIVPELNAAEEKLLEQSRCDLEDMLNLGRAFALGEDYYLHPCKTYTVPCLPPCPVATPCNKKASKN